MVDEDSGLRRFQPNRSQKEQMESTAPDVMVIVGERYFLCHSDTLMANSDYFRWVQLLIIHHS